MWKIQFKDMRKPPKINCATIWLKVQTQDFSGKPSIVINYPSPHSPDSRCVHSWWAGIWDCPRTAAWSRCYSEPSPSSCKLGSHCNKRQYRQTFFVPSRRSSVFCALFLWRFWKRKSSKLEHFRFQKRHKISLPGERQTEAYFRRPGRWQLGKWSAVI